MMSNDGLIIGNMDLSHIHLAVMIAVNCILLLEMVPSCQKLAIILENKLV